MKMIIALAFVLLLFGCTAQPAETEDAGNLSAPAEPAGGMTTEPVDPPEPVQTVTAEEMGDHSSVFSCWVAYDGNVYDVTSFLAMHEGGTEAITPYCGLADGSFANAFEGQHGTFKVSVLEEEGVLVGVLAQE